MSSTCPYILSKTSQLVVAARISSKNDNVKDLINSNKLVQKIVKLKSNLQVHFTPNVSENLPPRFNVKGFTTAAKYLCLRVKFHKLVHEFNNRSATGTVTTSVGVESVHGSEISAFDKRRETYFSEFGITEVELGECIREIKTIKNKWLHEENEHKRTSSDWSMFLRQKDLVVWRKPLNDNGLFEYKAFGSFHDISSKAFFNSQIDLNYRKSWDKYAIALDVIDKSPKCGSEVVHWVTKFPYPLKSRDYVFIRRSKVDTASNTMVLVSRAATHEDCPESTEYIRVKKYGSQMVIHPHRTFTENGFDYILTYHDDSRVNVPSFCVNMITGSALPDFMKTLHDAALRVGKT